ncbi:MAG: decaprenyl-phosphate phosphoribosyltransferase, partial [Kiritimatiellae bacterium]|nr:decaprenyl-phosphate phosphoribosyltransferase [Kiritimatiellia bacterium]
GAWLLSPAFAGVSVCYVLLQLAYSYGLKRVALLDIFMIAAGFVLRAVAGAAVIAVRISPWLLLCAFLLALFLALCKRRHEKKSLGSNEAGHRSALSGYNLRLLDQFIAIVSGATIVSYAMYTLSGETSARFGTGWLGLTIPFVMFGLFRYLDLVYRRDGGGRPERTLLTDKVLLATILLYALTALGIFLAADATLTHAPASQSIKAQ